jgi:hypothetical protein
MRGEAFYFGSPATEDSLELFEKALPLLQEAHGLEENNAMIVNRLAACLLKLGKKKKPIELLAHQQKITPYCSKIYWRMCWLLYCSDHHRNCLVTLHGASKYLTRSKTWSKLVSLARRILVVLFGSSVFHNSIATQVIIILLLL